MVELEIQDALWNEFVALAQRQRTRPQALVERVLREFIQRADDEELLGRSARAARRAPFRIEQTEEVVRQHRPEAAGLDPFTPPKKLIAER